MLCRICECVATLNRVAKTLFKNEIGPRDNAIGYYKTGYINSI